MPLNTGAMIALTVPNPEAFALNPPTENSTPADELHITLGYLGEASQITPEQREAIIDAAQTLADTSPAPEGLFPASQGVFPPDPESTEGTPLAPYFAAPSNTEQFNSLREDLLTHLAARGVAELVSHKHPVFHPHVTLAYAPLDTPPDLSHLPTPMPTKFGTLLVKFADERMEFPIGPQETGPELPLTASVRANLQNLAQRTNTAEDYLTAMYLRNKNVKATPAQTRAQASLNLVASAVDPHYRSEPFTRIKELTERAAIEPNPQARAFVAARALSLVSRTNPTQSPTEARELGAMTQSLRALIADGNSSAARSLRARAQLRDRYGRWIEQGGGVRFKVRVPGAPGGGTWYHGTVVGFDVPNGRVNVKLEDGRTVAIPNKKIEQPKAILGLNLGETINKAKKFVPKSKERKGKASLPDDFDPVTEKQNAAQDTLAVKAMVRMQADLQDIYTDATVTGGNIAPLVNDPKLKAVEQAARDAGDEFVNFVPTRKPAGTKFGEKPVGLQLTDIDDVRTSIDRITAENMPSQEALDAMSEADRTKAIQKARQSGYARMAQLFNERGSDQELLRAPAVGTDEDLEEVSPDAPQATEGAPTPDETVEAANEAFAELTELVPDGSPLVKARTRIGTALADANSRFLSGEDDLPTYQANLDRIKEYANAQEPSWKSPNAKSNPEQEAFGAFAEDLDNIHAATGGADDVAEAREAVENITTFIEAAVDLLDDDGTGAQGWTSTLDNMNDAANLVTMKMDNGSYLDDPQALADDLNDLANAVEEGNGPDGLGLTRADLQTALAALNNAADKVNPSGTAPAVKPAEAPEAPEAEVPEADLPEGIDDKASYDLGTPLQEALANYHGEMAAMFEVDGGDAEPDYSPPTTDDGIKALERIFELVPEIELDDYTPETLTEIAVQTANLLDALEKEGEHTPEGLNNFASAMTKLVEEAKKNLDSNEPAPAEKSDISSEMFDDIYTNIEEVHDSIPMELDDEVGDPLSAFANTIANTGKEYGQGKIDDATAAEYLKNAMADLNQALASPEATDALSGSNESDEIDQILIDTRTLYSKLVGNTDAQAPGESQPEPDTMPDPQEVPDIQPETAEAKGFDSLSNEEQTKYDALVKNADAWFSNTQALLESDQAQDLPEIDMEQTLSDFKAFADEYLNARFGFEDGDMDRSMAAGTLEEAMNAWVSSRGYKAIDSEDHPFDADVVDDLIALLGAQPEVVPTNEDPWATPDIPEVETTPVPTDGPADPQFEALQELLNAESEAVPDIKVAQEQAPGAVPAFEAYANALNNSTEDVVEDAKDVENAANLYLDALDAETPSTEDAEAFVEVEKDKVQQMLDALASAMTDDEIDAAGELENEVVDEILAALKDKGSPLGDFLYDALMGKIATTGEMPTELDLAAAKEFLDWIAPAPSNTPAETADINNASDALDVDAAVPADPTTDADLIDVPGEESDGQFVPFDFEAYETAPADHNLDGALATEEAVVAWEQTLKDFLDAQGPAAAPGESAAIIHNDLSEKQIENIKKLITDLPSPLGSKLDALLENHADGGADDALIQGISEILLDIPYSTDGSKLRGRLRGAQAGVQQNKGVLIPILRPKHDVYQNNEHLTEADLVLFSPDMVAGTINTILNQHNSGNDLKGLDAEGAGDTVATKAAIDKARLALEEAMVSFNAGDAESMRDFMRQALESYDEAIALRKGVHTQDTIVRRLRARRRSLDEMLAPFEGRWPDPIESGNPQDFKGGYDLDATRNHTDRDGNNVYPGDYITRTNATAKAQTGIVLGWRSQASKKKIGVTHHQALLWLDNEKKVRPQGVTATQFVLSAVGPNNPLYSDPSYTGPRVGDEDITTVAALSEKLQAKYDADAAKAPAPAPAPETPVAAPSAGSDLAGHPDLMDEISALAPGTQVQVGYTDDSSELWTKSSDGTGWYNAGNDVNTSGMFEEPNVESIVVISEPTPDATEAYLDDIDYYENVVNGIESMDELDEFEAAVDSLFNEGKIPGDIYSQVDALVIQKHNELNQIDDFDPSNEPLAEWEKELLGIGKYAPDAETPKPVFHALPPEEQGESGEVYVALEDGTRKWGRYGAAGIAMTTTDENGKTVVLVGKRGDRENDQGAWYLPGGALEEKENAIQGATRELHEEVVGGEDIAAQLTLLQEHTASAGKSYFLNADRSVGEATGDEWNYTTIIAELPSKMDIVPPENAPLYEFVEYAWVDAEELDKLDKGGFLHPALSNGAFANLLGFETGTMPEAGTVEAPIADAPGPEDLSTVKYDISSWKKVGAKLGFQEGGTYEDADGNRFYVKRPNNDTLAYNEVLASALYEQFGVATGKARLGTDSTGKLFVVSPLVKGNQDGLKKAYQQNDQAFLAKVREDFAIDAWLSNYDVVGPSQSNIIADENNNPVRVDQGGALAYRGTGSSKSWWGNKVSELKDLRKGSNKSGSYSTAAQIFGSMTDDEVRESAKKLAAISTDDIETVVHSSGLSDAAKADLINTLKHRRHDILKQTGLLDDDSNVDKKSVVLETQLEDAQALMNQAEPTDVFTNGSDVFLKNTGEAVKIQSAQGNGMYVVTHSDGSHTLVNPGQISTEAPETSDNFAFSANGHDFSIGDTVWGMSPGGYWFEGTLSAYDKISGSGTKKAFVKNSDGGVTPFDPEAIVTPEAYAQLASVEGQTAYAEAPAPAYATTLGEGYSTLSAGAKPLKKKTTSWGEGVLVQHADGTLHIYSKVGTVQEAYKQNVGSYKAENGWIDFTTSSGDVNPGTVTEATDAPAAPTAAPEVGTKETPTVVGPKPEDARAFKKLPIGSKVINEDGTFWYKVADDSWSYFDESAVGIKDNLFGESFDTWTFSYPVGTASNQATSATSTKPTSTEEFENLPVGTKVKDTEDGTFWTKLAPNSWDYSGVVGQTSIPDSGFEGTYNDWEYEIPSDVAPETPSTPEAPVASVIDPDAPLSATGQPVQVGDVMEITKYKPKELKNETVIGKIIKGTPGQYDQVLIQLQDSDGNPLMKNGIPWVKKVNPKFLVHTNEQGNTITPPAAPAAPETPFVGELEDVVMPSTMEAFGSLPIGSEVYNLNNPSLGYYKKTAPNAWSYFLQNGASDDDAPYADENFDSIVTGVGKGDWGVKIPGGAPAAPAPIPAPEPAPVVPESAVSTDPSVPSAAPGEFFKPENTPSSVVFSNPNPDSPLYGQPAPTPPSSPEQTTTDLIGQEWVDKVNEQYKARKIAKGQAAKDVQASSYWNQYFVPAMQGNKSALEFLNSNNYLTPELYAEATANIDAAAAAHAAKVAAFEAELANYSQQVADWNAANGTASVVPVPHSAALSWSHNEAWNYMQANYKPVGVTGQASSGIGSQKSGGWQESIRKMSQLLGLDREEVKKVAGDYNIKIWDNITEAGKQAPKIKEPFRAMMTRRTWQFSGKDGKPFKNGDDLTDMIGTVQKEFGAMEMTPGSIDNGGKYGYAGGDYNVIVDLVVPVGVNGVWTGNGEWGFKGKNSEMGFIAESGLALYIWDVQPGKYVESTHGGGRNFHTVVKASLIPKDALPYMNNFAGGPGTHPVVLPENLPDNLPTTYTPNALVTPTGDGTNDGTVTSTNDGTEVNQNDGS